MLLQSNEEEDFGTAAAADSAWAGEFRQQQLLPLLEATQAAAAQPA